MKYGLKLSKYAVFLHKNGFGFIGFMEFSVACKSSLSSFWIIYIGFVALFVPVSICSPVFL